MAQQLPKKRTHEIGIYSKILITRSIPLHIRNIGNNLKDVLERKLASEIEGKCIAEGYIKPNSVAVLTYSSGIIRGNKIIFEIVFECLVSSPVEGMHIRCVAKNITKAGIRAEIDDASGISPLVIFIARDHHQITPYFSSIKESSEIKVRVIGQRFELNDKYISIIAELIEPSREKVLQKKKLVIA